MIVTIKIEFSDDGLVNISVFVFADIESNGTWINDRHSSDLI